MQEQTKISGVGAIKKLCDVMSELDWIPHNASVNFGNTQYSYTSEQQMIVELRPLMKKHRLLVVPIEIKKFDLLEKRVIENKKQGQTEIAKENISYIANLIVVYRFIDGDSGDWLQVEIAGQGADNLDKAVPKALTACYKYLLRQATFMGLGLDPEATTEDGVQTGSTAVRHPAHALQRAFADSNLDLGSRTFTKLFEEYNITISDTLPITPELKSLYGKIYRIAADCKSGTNLEKAIENFRKSME